MEERGLTPLLIALVLLFLSISSVSAYICASDREVIVYCGEYSQQESVSHLDLKNYVQQLQVDNSNYKLLGIVVFSLSLLIVTVTALLVRRRLKNNAR